MVFDLRDLRNIRKKFDITQVSLARKSGVSQSLIAKIESGRLDPTYSNANRIINALNTMTSGKEIKADEIMNKRIFSVKPNENVKDVVKVMKKYEISQMPVVEDNNVVGMISETEILNSFVNDKINLKVSEVMDDAPPMVSPKSNLRIISNLLKVCPMIIVAEKGNIKGLITKSDFIGKVYG